MAATSTPTTTTTASDNAWNQPQSVELQDRPGVYKSGLLADDPRAVVERFLPDVGTLYEGFLRGKQLNERSPCLGKHVGKLDPFEFIDYAEVDRRSRALGSAFIRRLGLKPETNTRVAIYARNCTEWFLTALACVRHRMVVVPLYDTLGADTASYIIKHTNAQVIVVDERRRVENVLAHCDDAPQLRHIVTIDASLAEDAALVALARAHSVALHAFDAFVESVAGEEEADNPPTPDDPYIICYTSGTTGTPKGVLLTHKNLIANITGVAFLLDRQLPEMLTDPVSRLRTISYLPLSHMFEQDWHWFHMMFGGCVGYTVGTVADMSDEMRMLKPTTFPVVPRLLNRFSDLMNAEVAKLGMVKRWLYNMAYAQKLAMLKRHVVTKESLWDRLVFHKAQEQLGGSVRFMITGSAPISAPVLEQLRVVFGAYILEAYGQTECTALATITSGYTIDAGHVGGPAVCSLVKLEDVPEMNYFAREGRGEMMIWGPSVTTGYFQDAGKTAELFDADGFLHTGDVGERRADGTFRIIDRKKHIFKLAQGEYVAPEKIENIYVQSKYVQQVYVDGDSLERFLVAIVVPGEHQVQKLFAQLCNGAGCGGGNNANGSSTSNGHVASGATTKPNGDADNVVSASECKNANGTNLSASGGDGGASIEHCYRDKRVVAAILADMQQLGKAQKLNSIEQVKAIWLEQEHFSVENDLLTPTLKAKRPQLRQKYREIIAELYREANKSFTEKK